MISSRSHSYKKFMIQLDKDEQRKISYIYPLSKIVAKFDIKNLICLLLK